MTRTHRFMSLHFLATPTANDFADPHGERAERQPAHTSPTARPTATTRNPAPAPPSSVLALPPEAPLPDPTPVTLVALAAIDDAALPRDRSVLDADALRELRDSILASGLRMPVELFPLADPTPEGPRYGILSGYRRLTAFRDLDAAGLAAYGSIPAFIRPPSDLAAALAAMVEENAIRTDLSPWEQGRIVFLAREHGVFPTIEEAVERLHPTANPTKRTRLRALARLVEALDGAFAEPERLSLRQALRLANAVRAGLAEPMAAALHDTLARDAASQWTAVEPYLVEAETLATTAPDTPAAPTETRGRPRRILRPRGSITIRREFTRGGYLLRITGRDATSAVLDTIMDVIERTLVL